MVTLNQIENFLSEKRLAIAGVSRDSKKFGHLVFKHLREHGYDLCPINPNTDKIDDFKCYTSVKEIPELYDRLLIVTPVSKTQDVLKEAIERGIKQIWIQNKSENMDVIKLAKEKNIDIIYKKCIFMFAEPVEAGHKFHRAIAKFFGSYPGRRN